MTQTAEPTESTESSENNKTENHCINELQAITDVIHLNNLSNPSGIDANYSTISSVAYHYETSTLLFAGDFFYIDPKNTSNRTYYQYFQAYTHTPDNKFSIKYFKYHPYINVDISKFLPHQALRSWTRIIAHPSLDYFFLLGLNNLTAHNVTDGKLIWTATIPPCADMKKTNDPHHPIIYNDATFFKKGITVTEFLRFLIVQ